jgi:hypothetical protein
MVFIWIGGPQLGIDLWSAGLALLVLAAVVLFIATAIRRKLALSVLAGLFVLGGTFYFTYRTLVTPSGSWPVMYAAVNEKAGVERRERIAELLPLWHHGEVRRVDWYVLSRRWGVCHRMWEESGCRMPAGHMEPEGFVREEILLLANELK